MEKLKPHAATPEISVQTRIPPDVLHASADTARAMEAGNVGEAKKAANTLVENVAQDFKEHGAPLPPKAEKTLHQKVEQAIDHAGTNVIEKVFSPDMRKDLQAYRDQVADIEKTYNFSATAPEFYEAAKKIRRNSVLMNMGMYGITSSFNALRLGKIVDESVKMATEQQWTKKVGHGLTALRETLPYIYTLGLIPPIVSGEKVGKQFEQSTLKLRQAINKRVSESVFMRDFEFIHDKPASEIMNVIDKGKDATIDLMRTTYKEIIPSVAMIGTTVATEALYAPPAGILALLRIPMFARHSEQMARDILKERAENLQRKDVIDARILSSLQSLEVVRTTDSMVNAMKELQDNMAKSDTVEQEALSKQGVRDSKHEKTGVVYSAAIPIVSAGWEALMQRNDLMHPKKDADLQMAIASVGLSALSTWMLEGMNQETVEKLVHTYTDKLQPAIQDIKRMDELLGPYEAVDAPDGPKEQARIPVEQVKNFDISIKNLSFKNILHNVSLDIPQGSFVTIKGPSGIGKTTFLRHMLGLFSAEKGMVQYGGKDLDSIKRYGEHSSYSKIAYANQNPQYFENMTLRENLLLWTQKKIDAEKITKVLEDLHLTHIADRLDSKVSHFSGGELRRIGIARALLKDPKVMFLDEPTSNLDATSAKQVLEIIREMRRKRPDMTVVAVTHDPDFEAIAERVVDFAEVNRPNDTRAESLGTRQVFYASAGSTSKQ